MDLTAARALMRRAEDQLIDILYAHPGQIDTTEAHKTRGALALIDQALAALNDQTADPCPFRWVSNGDLCAGDQGHLGAHSPHARHFHPVPA